ncbi:MAG: group 1 truncated hemoglobin [Chloroflexota bacterium]
MAQTIYAKYGFNKINDIVRDFYGRIQQSPLLIPYFKGINVERVMYHQTQFLCFVSGGPVDYSGQEMIEAHRNLHITDEAFTEIKALLKKTLEAHGVEDNDREVIAEVIEQHRVDLVAQ